MLNPAAMTAGDLCEQAMRECGALGVGQTALGQDLAEAQFRLQTMLQEWERKGQLVYHTVDCSVVSTGAQSYTIGPGGQIDTNVAFDPFGKAFDSQFGPTYPVSVRPAKLTSAFVRQLVPLGNNQIDYPLRLLQSRDDYNKIALKSLATFPAYLWYDPAWPLGVLWPWPVPQASIYELHVSIVEQLPPMFASSAAVVNLPFEFFNAILYNLALRLRGKYGLMTFQGDPLPGLAKDSLGVLRASASRIAALGLPAELLRGNQYNIFSDRIY